MNTTKVAIELGEKVFNVEVRELTSEEKKEVAARLNVEQNKVESYASLNASLKELNEQYETNKALLFNAEMPFAEKVKMLWEQKTLLSEIRTLRPNVEAKAKEPVYFENIAKEQFRMMIAGGEKDAFMKEIEALGKTYREILGIIIKEVNEAKEKKSSNS